jgi:hypothetical protein
MATLLGVALLVSCQHGDRPATTPQTTTSTAAKLQKLGCHDVCHRTFQDCMGQMLLATGKVTQTQLNRFVRSGLMGMAKMTGYAGCMRRCQQGQAAGQSEKTQAVKRCLKKRSCQAYAACMIPPRPATR